MKIKAPTALINKEMYKIHNVKDQGNIEWIILIPVKWIAFVLDLLHFQELSLLTNPFFIWDRDIT